METIKMEQGATPKDFFSKPYLGKDLVVWCPLVYPGLNQALVAFADGRLIQRHGHKAGFLFYGPHQPAIIHFFLHIIVRFQSETTGGACTIVAPRKAVVLNDWKNILAEADIGSVAFRTDYLVFLAGRKKPHSNQEKKEKTPRTHDGNNLVNYTRKQLVGYDIACGCGFLLLCKTCCHTLTASSGTGPRHLPTDKKNTGQAGHARAGENARTRFNLLPL